LQKKKRKLGFAAQTTPIGSLSNMHHWSRKTNGKGGPSSLLFSLIKHERKAHPTLSTETKKNVKYLKNIDRSCSIFVP
jgi:hypothetical protein